MTVASRTITAKPRLLIVFLGLPSMAPTRDTSAKTPISTIRRNPEDRRATGYSKCWRRRRDLFRIGQEGLAEALGVTSARVRQLLKELAAAGTIRVRTSSTGSLITLVEGGRA
jgi:hypothetical protein